MSGVPPKMAKIDRNGSVRYRSNDAIIVKCGSDAINAVDNVRCPLSENVIHCGSGSGTSMGSNSVMRGVGCISSSTRALHTIKPSSDKEDLCASGSAGIEKREHVDGAETQPGEQPLATTSAVLASQITGSKLGVGWEIKDEAQGKNSDGTSSTRILAHNQEFVDNGPAVEVVWKGSFEIFHNEADVRFCEGIVAHPSAKVSRKALEFSKQITPVLMFEMHPRSAFWPKIFRQKRPDRNDVALYFYPGKYERSKRQYSSLLKFIEKQGLVLWSRMGKVELLVFPSKLLDAESQKLNDSYFLWGVFSCTKGKSVAEKAHLSSSLVVASH